MASAPVSYGSGAFFALSRDCLLPRPPPFLRQFRTPFLPDSFVFAIASLFEARRFHAHSRGKKVGITKVCANDFVFGGSERP